MRLIDADALREDWLQNGENEYVYDANAFLESIDDAPTVDAVEVVHCEDCKYYSRGICWNENITGNCDCDLEKEPNGYCDWGERRDGD